MARAAHPVAGDRYTSVAIAFHWGIAALVLANLFLGLGGGLLGGFPVMPVHKAIGLTVLVLTAGRIAWRLTHRPPPLPHDVPRWQVLFAHANHLLFYLLTILLPLNGWLMVSAAEERRPLMWFGLFDIPYLPVGQSGALSGAAATGHGVMGYTMLALVLLHVAAALKHQFVDRDRTLARIAPAVASREI